MKVLDGTDLAAAVREMFANEAELRCAVAFWGREFSKLARDRGAKVILDVSMGGTSKASLEALGVGPEKLSNHAFKHVRVLNGLHTKIFLGASRCILGSANASGAALGHAGGVPKLREAAILLEREHDATAFEAVERLWQGYLDASREVTLADHERAPRVAVTSAARDRMGEPADATSILQTVLIQPGRFNNAAFAFGDSSIDKPDLKAANAGYEQAFEAAPKTHGRQHICSTDQGDGIDEAFRSASEIINFWFGPEPGLYAYHDIVRIEHDDSVSYYGRRSWPTVARQVGLAHLRQDAAWKADEKRARKLAKLEEEVKGSRYVALRADALFEALDR